MTFHDDYDWVQRNYTAKPITVTVALQVTGQFLFLVTVDKIVCVCVCRCIMGCLITNMLLVCYLLITPSLTFFLAFLLVKKI